MRLKPWDFYKMTYEEYLLAFVGHTRSYFMDYAKFRSIAYQTYISQPREKGKQPVSLQKYLFLPYVDQKGTGLDINHHKQVVERFKAKLQNGK